MEEDVVGYGTSSDIRSSKPVVLPIRRALIVFVLLNATVAGIAGAIGGLIFR